MAKWIKIVQPGWEGFTGEFGMVEFKDGVSTDRVSPRQFNVLAASIGVVEVDEAGEDLGAPGIQDNMKGAAIVPAPVLGELPRATDEDKAAETKADAKAAGSKTVEPHEVVYHTQEQLEAIAEKSGVKGLRLVADPLGVKGRSINELVKEILKAESVLKVKAAALAAGTETTREVEQSEVKPETDVQAEGEADEAPTEQPEEPAGEEKPEGEVPSETEAA